MLVHPFLAGWKKWGVICIVLRVKYLEAQRNSCSHANILPSVLTCGFAVRNMASSITFYESHSDVVSFILQKEKWNVEKYRKLRKLSQIMQKVNQAQQERTHVKLLSLYTSGWSPEPGGSCLLLIIATEGAL